MSEETGGQGVQLLTPEQTEELFKSGQLQDQPEIQQVPVTIHTENNGPFTVEDFNSWALTPNGAFATGKWTEEDESESDILIPYSNINFIEYHFQALEEFYKQADESPAESAPSAEGEVNASTDGDSTSS